jgi:uncharacterized membrane protein YedE/YeeE
MPTLDDGDDRDDGLIALVKETASGIGQLVADHIRLARIEMTADARGTMRDVALLLVAGFIFAMGYGLACIAAGAALARVIGTPLAFVGLGMVHIVAGVVALAMITGRMKHIQLMQGTKHEVNRSVSALTMRSH